MRATRTSVLRHRLVTGLRRARMAPRRRRALRDLHAGGRPAGPGAGPQDTGVRDPDASDGGVPGVGGATGGVGAGAQDDAIATSTAPPATMPTVLVIAHVYYPELWDELADRVSEVPGAVDLAVTLVTGRSDHLAGPVRDRFPGATVRVLDNRGRDVWPLLQVLDLLPGHELVLKVHTKRSPQLADGDGWRSVLLDALCGEPSRTAQIQALFAHDPRIGAVAAPGNVLGREFLGNNAALLRDLVGRAGLTYDSRRLWFPAGSMFWARPQLLRPLGDLGLRAEDFGIETGAIDGTLPHAVERFLGVVAADQGLAVVESSEVAALLAEAGVARMRS